MCDSRGARYAPFLFAIAVASGAAAQRVWIADRLLRPGSHFDDLPAAVAAAAAGDIVVVRETISAGGAQRTYTAPTVAVPLTIVGEELGFSRPVVTGRLAVQGIDAGQHATFCSLDLAAAGEATMVVDAAGNTGALLFANCRARAVMFYVYWGNLPNPPPPLVQFADCRDVTLLDCEFELNFASTAAVRSRLRVQGSTIESTSLFFGQSLLYQPAQPALVLVESAAHVAASNVLGSGGLHTFWMMNPHTTGCPPGPAVRLAGPCELRCGPGSRLRAGVNTEVHFPWPTTTTYHASVEGPVVADPGCVFEGRITGQHRVERFHETRVTLARLGGSADVGVVSDANALALVAVSWRPDDPIATGFGDVWLDLRSLHVLGVGVTDAAGWLAFPMPLTTCEPLTLPFAAQALVLLHGALTLASPAFSVNLPPRR